jgi:hypothetical protein
MTEEWSEEMGESLIINRIYAIQIDPGLCIEHPPLVDRATWIGYGRRVL